MTHTNCKRLVLTFLTLIIIAGCTSTRVSYSAKDIDPWEVQKLKIGETSKEDVVLMFGPPVAISLNSDGQEVYTFVSGNSLSQVWQIPPIIVIYVSAVSSAKTKVLSVVFSGDTVIKWNYTISSAGGGFQAGGVQGGTFGE